MKILVSACLMGAPCRYDGCTKPHLAATLLQRDHILLSICPEVAGGLRTPRLPAERVEDRVLRVDGGDVTEAYQNGAACALRLVKEHKITLAVLKERSPSCGVGKIYDGTFSKTLKDGDGVTAELLRQNGVEVIGETEALRRIEEGRL